MILLYTTIAHCVLIKWLWHVKLRWRRLFDKSVSTYTGSSIKEMLNPARDFIYRADGEWQQVRGFIWDLHWVCFDGTRSYEQRREFHATSRLCADIIDHRNHPTIKAVVKLKSSFRRRLLWVNP